MPPKKASAAQKGNRRAKTAYERKQAAAAASVSVADGTAAPPVPTALALTSPRPASASASRPPSSPRSPSACTRRAHCKCHRLTPCLTRTARLHRPPDQKENTREEEPSRQRSRHRMAHHRDPGACDAGGDCRVRVCLLCVLPREPVTCTCTCTCTCVCLGMCLNMFLDNLPALRYFRYPQKASPPPPRPGFCFFVQASASPFLNVSQRWLLDHPRCLWPRRSLLTQTRYTQFSVSHAPMRPA